jgi:hypothetical protein
MRKILRNWLLTASVRRKKKRETISLTLRSILLSMTGLTSAVWTLGMFQMVTWESCQCIRRTKQKEPCHVGVRHAACTVPKCGFVIRYQNTSNLEQHYIRGVLDHKELAGRLAEMQQAHRAKLYICTLLEPKVQALQLVANTQVLTECPCYAQCVYSFVRLYDRG